MIYECTEWAVIPLWAFTTHMSVTSAAALLFFLAAWLLRK
jgi:hypothetical protein